MVRHNKQINAQDWDDTDLHVQGIQRRTHARFEASLHVAYEAGGRRAVAFSQNISQGGMLLRHAPGLYAGSEVDFVVTLNDGDMPLEVRGEVLAVSQQGVRVCFASHQPHVTERLANYVRAQVVPALETEMARPISSLQHVVELANLYADQGRHDDAVNLYRAQLGKRSRQIALYEHMTRLISTRLIMMGQASEAELTELTHLVKTGLALGSSPLLEQAQQVVDRFRAEPRPPAAAAPTGRELEAREHALQAREHALQAGEEALTQAAAQLRKQQQETAARHEEVAQQLGAWQTSYEANVKAWVQRLRQFSATLGVKLTARQQDMAALNESLKNAQAQLTEREASLAQHAELNQTITVLKQNLEETRAILEHKTRLLAGLTAQTPTPMTPAATVPDVHVSGHLQGRVSGAVEMGTSQMPLPAQEPQRLEDAGFGDDPTGKDLHVQGRYWEGEAAQPVISAEEVVDEAEPVTSTMAVPQAPAYKWRVR